MEIQFKPFVSDQFVEVVKDEKISRKHCESLINQFGDEKGNEIIKSIIIASLHSYRININDLIDHLKGRD